MTSTKRRKIGGYGSGIIDGNIEEVLSSSSSNTQKRRLPNLQNIHNLEQSNEQHRAIVEEMIILLPSNTVHQQTTIHLLPKPPPPSLDDTVPTSILPFYITRGDSTTTKSTSSHTTSFSR